LLVMFALLEASTANTDRFLFSRRNMGANAASLFRVLLAPFAMLFGTPLAVLCLVFGRRQE
ncbi:MAG TPA: hypothetical protein VFH33_04470, partial [Candidatus Krumholzibacteria bacterium]|nr:hypothetical protein [Candidatus Krumholzibacteria bacterium]